MATEKPPPLRKKASGNRVLRGIFFAALGGTCWGFSGTCAQLLTGEYGLTVPWITSIRLTAAAVIFLAVCGVKNWRALRAAVCDLPSLLHTAGFAILGLLLTQFSYLYCISYTNAGIGTVLERLGLVVIMLYVCLRVRRLPHKREALGLVFALAGVFLIATQGKIDSLAIPLEGLVWGLISAVSLAFYSLMPVKPLAKWGSFIVTGLAMTIGAITSNILVQPWTMDVDVNLDIVLVMTAMVIIGTFGAYLFYLQGVNDAGGLRAGLVGCMEPVSAMVISAVWLGTAVTGFDIAGTVLIIIMVGLTTQREEETDRYSGSPYDVPAFCGASTVANYYRIRKATSNDFNDFQAVLKTGHEAMEELGIDESFSKRYPSERRVMQAIDHGNAYVVALDASKLKQESAAEDAEKVERLAGTEGRERIVGVFSLDPQGDKSYGYAYGASWQTPMDADYAALHWVTVIPEFRGWGVGKAILDEAVRIASEQKKLSIRADLYEENAPACKLLERFGFVRCGHLTIRNSMGRTKERAAFELVVQ